MAGVNVSRIHFLKHLITNFMSRSNRFPSWPSPWSQVASFLAVLGLAGALTGCNSEEENAAPSAGAMAAGQGVPVAGEAASAALGARRRALATQAQLSKWSAVQTLPLVPVSAANLPDGRVLMWSAEEKFSFGGNGRTYSLTYDPATQGVSERLVSETGHDMFCTGTTNLADGRLLVNGGLDSARTSLFDPVSGAWTTGALMNIPRGYQANTLLQDGSVLTLGGSWSGGVGNKHGEVWTAAGGWRRLSGVPIDPFLSVDASRNFGGDSHFWLIPAGNGRVFHAGPGMEMHWIDTQGNGQVTSAGRRGDDEFSISGSTVMFEAGKILKTGGGPGYDSVNANANSYVIDLNAGVSVRKLAPMTYRRAFHNSVVLPNGQVVILGGQTYAVGFSDNNAVLAPELWDPATEAFTALPAMAVPRNYHSVALLLPDGRVMVAGGGLCGAGCAANHPDLQVLSPPYLFNADGSVATRPVITAAPATGGLGQTLAVSTDSAVTSFALVRLSSTTHTVNNDQRRLVPTFRSTGTNTWAVDLPSNPGLALPGYWMLFAMNASGTPSVAKVFRLTTDGVPVVAPIADQTGSVSGTVSFTPTVTVPAGGTPAWRATGLPPGVTMDAATGRITGTLTQAGTYKVTVYVTAGGRTASTDFVWKVNASTSGGRGLKADYFANVTLSGAAAYSTVQAVNFDWGTGTPATAVPADNFSARWTGWVEAPVTGNIVFQTQSDDGVRLSINGVKVIDNWTDHGPTVDTAAAVAMVAGQRYAVTMEFYERGGGAVARLLWQLPGAASVAVPAERLYDSVPNRAPTLATPVAPSTSAGTATSLTLAGADLDGNPLTYSATGLPPGLVLNTGTGVISGTPTTGGSYTVNAGVSDGQGGTAAVTFTWVVQAAATLPTLAPAGTAPLAVGAVQAYNATPSVAGTYSYQWNFGDGTPATAWSATAAASHTYTAPGVYLVSVTLRLADGRTAASTFWQAVYGSTGAAGRSSTAVLVEPRSGSTPRLWSVNPDHNSVSVFDLASNARVAIIAVGAQPRTLALAPDGRIWVANKGGASLSILSPTMLSVTQTVALPRGSQPYGVVVGTDGTAFVTLEATGRVARVSAAGVVGTSVDTGPNVRHLALNGAGNRLLVSRFITPALPGEGTAVVQTSLNGAARGGELLVLDPATLARQGTVVLQHSERPDTTIGGRGIPNYLGAPVIAPDGQSLWVPSKQDNIRRGALRDGNGLTFENTVRAISSRVSLSTLTEDTAGRIDHDNSGVASAAAFHPTGAYLFVALEASRHVAVVDPVGKRELFRVDAGRAPQGLAVSPDGFTLYVHNFMDRSIGVHDLRPLLQRGQSTLPLTATLAATASEVLSAQVLQGKRLFYDARDPRLARDGYMSCAACHNDGGHDGRTWDFTGQGEGLRNTITLRGRAGAQGLLHWSGNFDEVQDFEGQIRGLQAGTGLMTDAQFSTGTRNQPLGDRKTGVSTDLDALAAYVASLSTFAASPWRNADGTLTAAATAGRQVFIDRNCAQCHGGAAFTSSSTTASLMNIGTVKPASGKRLGGTLTGIDSPTLREVWATGPYLHDGSAATLADAVTAHNNVTLTATDLGNVVAYLQQTGNEEASAPAPAAAGGTSPLFGGTGGTAFTDGVAAGQVLTGVTVRAGWWLDGVQGLATPANLPSHGGTGGGVATFTLASGEYLVRLYGKVGNGQYVSQLSFVTNTGRVFGPYGLNQGFSTSTSFDYTVPAGNRIVGFTGRASTYLDAIGVVYRP